MTVLETIARIGIRRKSARITREQLRSGKVIVRVHYRAGGVRAIESFDDTPKGKKLARQFAEDAVMREATSPTTRASKLTLGELRAKYETAKRPEWSPRTFEAQRFRAQLFIDWATPQLLADRVNPDTLDQFREDMRKQDRAVTEIQRTIGEVLRWFRYSASRGWITANALASFSNRIARHERPAPIPEFNPDEFARIFAALDYRDARLWRPWVAIVLGGVLGPRQNALRHLRWDDVDLNAMTVTWRRQHDKMARERVQPLPRAARFALRIARVWYLRLPAAQQSGFVLPAVNKTRTSQPYTYQALNKALHLACDRAGVARIQMRAMHSLRRHAARTMLELTKDLKVAGEWIGDIDLGTLSRSYLRDRPEGLAAAAKIVVLDPKAKRKERPNDNHSNSTGGTDA